MSQDSGPLVEALQAAEEAVEHLRLALAAHSGGTANAWEARGHWRRAVAALKRALEGSELGLRMGYRIERDETGKAVRLWWGRPDDEGA